MTITVTKTVKIAVIGAGPAGLAAAIFLDRLDFVQVDIFDQARELREVGAVSDISLSLARILPRIRIS